MKREQIDNKYKWNKEDIFKSEYDFYSLLKETEKKINFSAYKGKLNNAEIISECLNKLYSIFADLEKLSLYAYMTKDENVGLSNGIVLTNKIEDLCVKFDENTSFITPELSSLSLEKLKELSKNQLLKDYDTMLIRLIEEKPHVLDEKCEKLLAQAGKVLGGYHDIFSIVDNVDLRFPKIKVNGENVVVTHAKYAELLQNEDRNVRKKAFKSYYKAYESILNTITAIYKGNLDKDVFITKARNFKTCLERALFNEEVDKGVYENLLISVNKALPLLHRYIKDKKEILGYNINMYDIYVPLIKGEELSLDYDDAFKLVKEGLKPLGEDYSNLLQRAYSERWIDVYENEGKRSGAYSTSAYSVSHPYVLLNHNNNNANAYK